MNNISGLGQLTQKYVKNSLITDKISESFMDKLSSAVNEINADQFTSDESITKVVKGEMGIHEGMLDITQADISMRLLLQVRGKVMEAYKEIMRMPV